MVSCSVRSNSTRRRQKAGIKPIIGMEAYIVTKGSRFEKSRQETESGGRRASYHHLVLLAKNDTGYRNLIKLCSIAHLEGFYYKPRIDTEVLREHREGLVALSACAGGVVSAHLATGNDEEAYEAAGIYKEIFGDDFYIEIQDHGIDRERVDPGEGAQACEGPRAEARLHERCPLHEARARDRPQYHAADPRRQQHEHPGLHSTPVSDRSGVLQVDGGDD